MLNGKKIIVVLPAYNAAKTLEPTISEVPREVIDAAGVSEGGLGKAEDGQGLALQPAARPAAACPRSGRRYSG